jgi:YD repeat-containing protein
LLKYDSSGYLTNTVDVIGLSSSFVYDAGTRRSWITNLVTPYGTTTFRYGGVDADSTEFFSGNNQVNRFVEITQPNGGKHLYLYRQDCSGFMSATYASVPDSTPFANTLDNVDQDKRNSFHWSPLQYIGLSTSDVANLTSDDYKLASLRHWLRDSQTGNPSHVASLERAPSQDETTVGQMRWFDHPGKPSGKPSTNGTSALPCLEARVVPGAMTRYQCVTRNSRGTVTNDVSTYSATNGSVAFGTNTFLYSGEIDLLRNIGPQGEVVVSNYFNAYHQPLISYNALNEATTYTYNANRQLMSIVRPSGLTTTNVYYTGGDDAGRLEKTIDLEINRTNAFTYYANGLVYSHTDERGLTVTNFWDNLQRLTGVAYPDGTTTSNIYTALDITARKDRLGYWSYSGYNSVRQKIAETNANGGITRYGYCDCGALLSVTNAWNTSVQMVTSYEYGLSG